VIADVRDRSPQRRSEHAATRAARATIPDSLETSLCLVFGLQAALAWVISLPLQGKSGQCRTGSALAIG